MSGRAALATLGVTSKNQKGMVMMSTETARDGRREASEALPTGPVGWLVRMLLAAVLGWTVYDLWVDRELIFAGTDPLRDPGLWLLTALIVWGVYEATRLVGWGKRVLTGLAVLTVAAGAVAQTVAGTMWTEPLTWLVWGLDIVGATVIAITLVVAVALRVPGCELGVLRRLSRRLRDEPAAAQPMFCLAGLHKLDVWESRRWWHSSR